MKHSSHQEGFLRAQDLLQLCFRVGDAPVVVRREATDLPPGEAMGDLHPAPAPRPRAAHGKSSEAELKLLWGLERHRKAWLATGAAAGAGAAAAPTTCPKCCELSTCACRTACGSLSEELEKDLGSVSGPIACAARLLHRRVDLGSRHRRTHRGWCFRRLKGSEAFSLRGSASL